MMIEAVIIAAIIVKLSKGNTNNIKNFRLRDLKGLYIILIGFCLGIINSFGTRSFITNKTTFFIDYFFYLHILSLFLIALGFILNYKNPGILMISIGFFSNLIPIVLNGKMPVNYNAMLKVAKSTSSSAVHNTFNVLCNNGSLTHGFFNNPKLEILSDIIPLSGPYYNPKVISIGDIIITIGFIVAIVYLSRRKV